MGLSQIRGTLFRGLYAKDYSILAYILGSPYFGKLPYIALNITPIIGCYWLGAGLSLQPNMKNPAPYPEILGFRV